MKGQPHAMAGTPTDTAATEPAVELRGVSKRFGATLAVADVDLSIRRGGIHGLVGENGAGKSTAGKIITGVLRPDEGELIVLGEPRHFRGPRDALAAGVAVISQELSLVPDRAVVENVFLGVEPRRLTLVDRGALLRRYAELDAESGFGLDPNARVGDLRVADQQKVEILRALARNADILLFDEPTAALSRPEAAALVHVIRDLARRGRTVIFISHFLEEVLDLCEDVTIMRDGRIVRHAPTAAETPDTLVASMLGQQLAANYPDKVPAPADAPVRLSVRSISRAPAFQDVSFEIRAGEILGVAGLVGSGRSEVARAIFGAEPATDGEISLDGRQLRIRHPRDAVRRGIAMLPEDRKTQGLVLNRPISENLTLAGLDSVVRGGMISKRRERTVSQRLEQEVGVRGAVMSRPVLSLSGGNQQKVLFAKWLLRRPAVLLADEPTRGVDVGAKLDIYRLIVSLAQEGMAVLVISSDLDEVLGLAHRVVVMRRGRIAAQLEGAAMTPDAVMQAAFATLAEPDQEPSAS
jgi:ABC-type sugar transport system ATPase subunit